MPTKPYQTYVVAGVKDTLQNLVETGFYLYSYEIDHQIRKDEISKAECLGVGEPKQLSDGTKVVGIQYVGKLLAKGWLTASIKDNSTTLKAVSESGVAIKSELDSRLKQAFKNQLINFHSDAKERWGEKWRFGFFLMEHPNPVSSKAFYIAKMYHEMFWDFDSSGKLVSKDRAKARYYGLTDSIVLDTESGMFLKNGKEISPGGGSREKKKKLLILLAKAEGALVEKGVVCKALGLVDIHGSEKNNELLDIKRSLIQFDFKNKLGLSSDEIDEIFDFQRDQGYRLRGEFTDTP